MKRHEFDRVVLKLSMRTRDTHHRLAWFEHDGKVIARTRRSQGRGEVVHDSAVRSQLYLTQEDLDGLVSCSLTRDDYIEILRMKGKI